jgi:hypothetical protein
LNDLREMLYPKQVGDLPKNRQVTAYRAMRGNKHVKIRTALMAVAHEACKILGGKKMPRRNWTRIEKMSEVAGRTE